MFDKKTFSEILNKIYKTYTNQRDFANSTGVNRAYLSQYMNEKLENPPTPKILERIANNSNGIISYAQLMEVCGYIDVTIDINSDLIKQKTEFFFEKTDYLLSVGLTNPQLSELQNIINMDISSLEYKNALDNFLSTLSLETSYEVLKFLQEMLFELKKDFKEKANLANSLKKETYELFDKINETKELQIIKKSNNTFYKCPVYGQISAGQPNWAEECLTGYIPLDVNLMDIHNPEECFFLKVNGESMNKKIKNGSFALIHKQDIVEDGEIAVVLVNGYDATLKKFTKQGDYIILEPMSDDPSFTTQIYSKDTEIKILGKYIGKFEMNS